MSPNAYCPPPRAILVRVRWACALAAFLVVPGLSSFSFGQEKTVEEPPASHTFDRFDRTIVRNGALSAHVESRRRRPAREYGADSDEKPVFEVRFSRGVFEDLVYAPQEDEDACFKRLDRLLEQHVLSLKGRFGLDAAQQKKLRAASRGDLQQLREQVNALKKRFSEPDLIDDDHPRAVRAWALGPIDEALKLRAALNEADRSREGSMLDKVLRRQLTEKQIAEYEQRVLRAPPAPREVWPREFQQGRVQGF